MARMIPPQLVDAHGSGAEALLYHEFERQLSDDYTVFHSVGWINRTNTNSQGKGEADFVIVHLSQGILVLELKGGRIEGQSFQSTWVSIDRWENRHEISNPIDQAQRSLYALRDKLAENPASSCYDYPLSRGIIFPDILVADQQFGVNFRRSLLIDSSELGDLTASVNRLMQQPLSVDDNKRPYDREARRAFIELLDPPVRMQRLGLLSEVGQNEQQYVELSNQQMRLLRNIQSVRQCAINGCAGSGKTMLAVEKARQLAEEGFDVLLTCYNKRLGGWMQETITTIGTPAMSRITVLHYHELARQFTEQAGTDLTGRFTEAGFWEDTLPQLFSEAIPKIDVRYDAIIADEGQDFATEWWITLQDLLKDPKNGVFYIFLDSRQALYRDPEDLPVRMSDMELMNNYRNTVHIHDVGARYAPGDPRPIAMGPPGREISHLPVTGSNFVKPLGSALAEMMDVEGFTNEQIVVLTPAGVARSALKQGLKVGNRSLSWKEPLQKNEVRVSTIHSFKGLEAPVVIIAELEMNMSAHSRYDDVLYVGLTRAKHHLIVIGELPDPRE